MVVRVHRDGPDPGPGARGAARVTPPWPELQPGQLSFLIHISNQTPIQARDANKRLTCPEYHEPLKMRRISCLYQDCTANGIIFASPSPVKKVSWIAQLRVLLSP